jgi:hypothetical protein
VVRNFLTFSTHPVTISNGSGFVVEISNCDQTYGLAPPTSAGADDTRGADEFLGYWATECDRTPWPPGDETVVGAAKQQTGTDYIAAHKRQFPVVVAARVGRIWDVWRPQQSYDFNRFFENRKDITLGASGRREPGGRSADGGITFSPVLIAMVMHYPMLHRRSVAALVVLWRRRITIIPFVGHRRDHPHRRGQLRHHATGSGPTSNSPSSPGKPTRCGDGSGASGPPSAGPSPVIEATEPTRRHPPRPGWAPHRHPPAHRARAGDPTEPV